MVGISLSKQSLILILFFIFSLAFVLRYGESIQENWLSFGDGGRDLLVTKWVSEGKTEFNITPLSSLTFIPNSFLYFQMLGLVSKIGGIEILSLIPVLGGSLVAIFSFFIINQIFKSQWLGLWSAFLVSTSIFFIRTASFVWQPYIQFPFTVSAFLFVLMALYTHQKKYYWLSLLPIFFSLSLHHSGILTSIIFSFFLVIDYWFFVFKLRFSWHNSGYFFSMFSLWTMWLVFIYFGRSLVLTEVSTSEIGAISLFDAVEQLKAFVNGLFFAYSGHLFFLTWQKLLVFFLTIFALFRAGQQKFLPKRISIFILVCLTSLIFLVLVPGEEYRHWYFYFQTFLSYLLIPLSPRMIWPKKKNGNYLLILSVGFFSWLALRGFVLPGQLVVEPLNESRIAAGIIDSHLKRTNRNLTDFAIITKDAGVSENKLQNLIHSYRSASVQYQLELINSEYEKRIKVVDAAKVWSNYLEPESNQYYFFCFDYYDTYYECVEDIYFDEDSSFEIELISSYDLYRSIHVFSLKKDTEKDTKSSK